MKNSSLSIRFSTLKLLLETFPSDLSKKNLSVKIDLTVRRNYEQLDQIVKAIETRDYDVYILQNLGWFRLTQNPFPCNEVVIISKTAQLFCVPKKDSIYYVEFLHNSALNGAERAALTLNQELTSKGALATIIIPQRGPLEDYLKNLSIPTLIIPFSWWAGPKRMNKKIQEELVGSTINTLDSLPILAKMNPHFISSQTTVIPWGVLCATLLGKPHAIHIHEFGVLDHGLIYYFGWKWMMRLLISLSAFVSFNSKAVKSVYAPFLGKKKSVVFYTPANIPPQQVKAEIPYKFRDRKAYRLIVMGNITASKGQLLVVKAVTELVEEGYDIELLLLGQTNDSEYLREINGYIDTHPQTRITIHGFVKNPYPYLKQADALVVASRQEAYGLVVIEAFVLKKTVIASDSGGLPEFVKHKSNGLLFKSGDVADLKRQILFCIKNFQRCIQMEKTAFLSVQQFRDHYSAYAHQYVRNLKSWARSRPSHIHGLILAIKIVSLFLKLGLKILKSVTPLGILILGAIYTQVKLITLLVVTFRKTRELFYPASIGGSLIIGWAQYQGYPMYYETLLFFVFLLIPISTLVVVKLIVKKGGHDI